jgi:putative spermidine/putrescine transport system substrate-binding protein
MKKALLFVLAIAAVLSVCATVLADDLPTINFWTTGSQNVQDVFAEVIKAYNAKEDRAANVQLQFILSGTGETSMRSRYIAAYKAGNSSDFDVLGENGMGFLQIVQEAEQEGIENPEGIFIDLDFDKMPNLANVKMTPCIYPEKLVPYRGTTVVFDYDSAFVPEPPQTWDELVEWMKANPGRFVYNDPDTGGAGSSFVTAAIYRQIDDPDAFKNASDPKYQEMWDAGFEWLAEIHPYIYSSGGHVQYAVKNQGSLDLLGQGEVWMTPAWADGTLTALENKTLPETVKMYQLSDLSLTGSDVDMAVCATSQHVEEAYDFMNFVVSPEAQQIFVEVMKAVPVIDTSLLEQTASVEAVSLLNPADFNIVSTGANDALIKERWAEEIATLN